MNFKETLKFLKIITKTDLVPNLVGHTGVGKTELATQFSAWLGYKLIIVHMAQLEPSDFIGLYKTTAEGRTMTCPPVWLPFDSDEVVNNDKVTVVNGGKKNHKGYVILLDEINRGQTDCRQAMYQFLSTKCLHTYQAPNKTIHLEINGEKLSLPETILIATSNPTEGYETYEFDDALNQRLANVYFQPDVEETLTYLKGKHGDNLILSWLKTDTGLLEYGNEFRLPEVKLTPRTSDHAMKLWPCIENEDGSFLRKCLETIMPKDKAVSFISFMDEMKNISKIDVMNGVTSEKVKLLLKNNRLDVLSKICNDLSEILNQYTFGETDLGSLSGVTVSNEKAVGNIAAYLVSCPADMVMMLFNSLEKAYGGRNSIANDPTFTKVLAPKMVEFGPVLQALKMGRQSKK